MGTMMRNSWTTIFGILAGIVNYLAAVGPNLPSDRQGWVSLLFSAILAGLGVVAKDARGSTPK